MTDIQDSSKSLILRKFVPEGVYKDKSGVIQVFKSNYFDSSCLYSQKKIDFEQSINDLLFQIT